MKIASFDVHSKLMESVQYRTVGGAIVTIIMGTIAIMLTISEFAFYMNVETQNNLYVDYTFGNKYVNANVDLILHALPCTAVTIDMEDAKGSRPDQAGLMSVRKTPIPASSLFTPSKEGCRVTGIIKLLKVKGNFHIALGSNRYNSFNPGQRHQHQFSIDEMMAWNTTHTIQTMSFGNDFPGLLNPLEGMKAETDSGIAQYKYFIQLVPTVYEPIYGWTVHSNQYSVTKHVVELASTPGAIVHPGIFFEYDFSPIMVKFTETRRTLLQFITSLCAIVGGVLTVAGIIDSIVNTSAKAMKKAE